MVIEQEIRHIVVAQKDVLDDSLPRISHNFVRGHMPNKYHYDEDLLEPIRCLSDSCSLSHFSTAQEALSHSEETEATEVVANPTTPSEGNQKVFEELSEKLLAIREHCEEKYRNWPNDKTHASLIQSIDNLIEEYEHHLSKSVIPDREKIGGALKAFRLSRAKQELDHAKRISVRKMFSGSTGIQKLEAEYRKALLDLES